MSAARRSVLDAVAARVPGARRVGVDGVDGTATSWWTPGTSRCALRGVRPPRCFRDGTEPDPAHPSVTRYVQGNKRYFAACAPWDRATVVVDNSDLAHPRITALR